MAQVDHIKSAVEALSAEDFIQLRNWLAEKDGQHFKDSLEQLLEGVTEENIHVEIDMGAYTGYEA